MRNNLLNKKKIVMAVSISGYMNNKVTRNITGKQYFGSQSITNKTKIH